MSNREAWPGHGIVWLEDLQIYGEVVGRLGTFFTTIKYEIDGEEITEMMDNNEFELVEDLIEYDDDDD